VPHKTLLTAFNHSTYIDSFNDQFKFKVKKLDSVIRTVFRNFTVYMVSFEGISINGSSITASRIGICAPYVDITSSHLDSSGRGCFSHEGIGAGLLGGDCAGGGGAHASRAGAGAGSAQCAVHFARPHYFTKEARYEGSGGASGVRLAETGGSGGGIVWVSTTGRVILENSTVSADGANGVVANGTNGSGGGAGGSI